jgi:predicted MFS family arabinose efflux permease
LGIGGGALIGAVVYGAYGVGGVPWVYVAVLVLALILTTITGRLGRRPASSASQTN